MSDRNALIARYRAALASNGLPWDEYCRTLRDDVLEREAAHWEGRAEQSRLADLPARCTHPANQGHFVFPCSGGGERVVRKEGEE